MNQVIHLDDMALNFLQHDKIKKEAALRSYSFCLFPFLPRVSACLQIHLLFFL